MTLENVQIIVLKEVELSRIEIIGHQDSGFDHISWYRNILVLLTNSGIT